MMSKLLDHMNYVCIYTMYMYVVTIMPDLECEQIYFFHWIEKFPRYDTEKAHIQSTTKKII